MQNVHQIEMAKNIIDVRKLLLSKGWEGKFRREMLSKILDLAGVFARVLHDSKGAGSIHTLQE